MKQPSTQQLDEARKWASEAIEMLRQMPMNDRLFWRATKPRGQAFFNWVRVEFVCNQLPEFRRHFDDLDIPGHRILGYR